MPTTECSDCGGVVSTVAPTCPHCGRPLTKIAEVLEPEIVESEPSTPQPAQSSPNYLRLLVAVLVLGSLFALLARRLPLVLILAGAACIVLWSTQKRRR